MCFSSILNVFNWKCGIIKKTKMLKKKLTSSLPDKKQPKMLKPGLTDTCITFTSVISLFLLYSCQGDVSSVL